MTAGVPTAAKAPLFTVDELTARARTLITPGRRAVLGIVGSPGAGKSTLAQLVTSALGPAAVALSMDGFHLSNSTLQDLSRRDRKGAPDTFDVSGYVALLARLREGGDEVVYAPVFDRSHDESIGGAIAVGPEVSLVITEGNYLLHNQGGWEHVAEHLDETWFLDPGDEIRRAQLVDRHERFGLDREAAERWALGTDEANAVVVASTRAHADVVVRVPDLSCQRTD